MQLIEWQMRRERAHFLGNDQEIADFAAACDFVCQRQVVLPWPSRSIRLPLPSLRAAYKQPLQREPGPVWDWKDRLPVERQAFYGRLARKCRVLIARSVLPAFYRASGRTGDPEDYLIDYQEGNLAYLGKQVLDALAKEDCHTKVLRQRLGRSGVDYARLGAEIDHLRETFYLTHVDVGSGGNYGFVWGLVDRHWPEVVSEAMSMSKAAARRQVLIALLHASVLASTADLRRMTGWSQPVFDATLQPLLADGVFQTVAGSELLACRDN